MRALPNMTVISPADANETVMAVKAAAEYKGPVYLRINRNDMENVTAENEPFIIGEPKLMRQGSDVAVFATGITVSLAMEAAKELEGKVSVRVINVSTIKPMSEKKIIALAEGCRAVVCAEEHSIIGGLGSAVAEAMRSKPKPMKFVGIKDTFGCSAHNYQDLLEHYGITSKAIAAAVQSIGGAS